MEKNALQLINDRIAEVVKEEMSSSQRERLFELQSLRNKLSPPNIDNFKWDWRQTWTIQQAEYELSGFGFKGLGWYHIASDTILVLKHVDDVYEFFIWNQRDPRETLNNLLDLPMYT